MDLENSNICIDGVNLQDSSGTGIKTYALTLLNALNSLNARTSVLLSKWIPKNAQLTLDQPKNPGPKGYYSAFPKFFLRRALKAKAVDSLRKPTS